jgi:hypothetical protein
MQIAFPRKNIIYKLVLILLLIISTFVLFRLSPTLFKPDYLLGDDFLPFWAAGNQNLQGKNPIDPQIIEQRKIQEGSNPSISITSVMLNPPWTISLLMPFGLIKYPLSRLIWLIFSIVLILLSTQLLWRIYSGKPKQQWLPILMVFIFAPTISVLEKGQITPIVIIGITGFLFYTSYRQNDWLAGIFLALTSVKPQVAIFFWIAVLFWVAYKRRWQLLFSCSITIIIMTLIALIFNQNLILQYIDMLRTYHITEWATPTIGAYLRLFWLGTEKFWLQFLPTMLGFIWFIYYWFTHKESWNWLYIAPTLLFVSQLTSPYSWSYDLVIVIPAIILATVWMVTDWKHWSILFLSLLFLVINAIDLILHMKLDEFWFIWLAPALLIWFFLVRWISQKYRDKELITAVG